MRTPLFIVKVLNFEYWPWWVFYLPLVPYWLMQSIKAKSLTFFSAVNPGIDAGGFYGEKKSEILCKIPAKYLPITFYILPDESIEYIIEKIRLLNLNYPIIAKPNIGERGNKVEKINSSEELADYHQNSSEEYLIQEFVSYEMELGVLYSRLPSEINGSVSSITMKEFLSVKGDGKKQLHELISDSSRARFQWEGLKKKFENDWHKVLENGEIKLLEPIGNHCKGTKFLNVNHLINEQVNKVFDEISMQFEGFYYGRYDLKVASVVDFYNGQNIKIMELNGVSSDPGHIYDPRYKLLAAYKDLSWHWKRAADISIENQKSGIKPLSIYAIIKILREHFS